MDDIVAELRSQAEQILQLSALARLGEDCCVRVLAPDILHAIMMDAADEIEDMRKLLRDGLEQGDFIDPHWWGVAVHAALAEKP